MGKPKAKEGSHLKAKFKSETPLKDAEKAAESKPAKKKASKKPKA